MGTLRICGTSTGIAQRNQRSYIKTAPSGRLRQVVFATSGNVALLRKREIKRLLFSLQSLLMCDLWKNYISIKKLYFF